jgi:hypothetical protein
MNDELVSKQTKIAAPVADFGLQPTIIGEPINLSEPIQSNPISSILGMNEPLPLGMNEPSPLGMNEPKINPIIPPFSRGVTDYRSIDPNTLYGSAPEIKIDPYRNQMPIVAPKLDNTITNLCPPCPKCGCQVIEGFYGTKRGGDNNLFLFIIILIVIFYLMKK